METVRQELGYKEKSGQFTKFGQWYADHVQDTQFRDAPWCDMFLAWAADKSGLTSYVGEFAWTPSHAAWFMKQGAWSRQPEPGALVFYDWRGGKSYKGIDHVGVVERVEGKKIHTIEANVDGVWLKRKTRETDKVVGYGIPRLVKENADRAGELRGTEQPFVRDRQPAPGGSPLDFLGTPPALLAAMVLATVVLSLRFTRRRGVHRRLTWSWLPSRPWSWDGQDGQDGQEGQSGQDGQDGPEREARPPAPIPPAFRDRLTRVGSTPVPERPRPPERLPERPRERVRVGGPPQSGEHAGEHAGGGSGQATATRPAPPARRKPYDPR
ncbi:CHAP domain-containing protein [Nonomuraea sp. NPDC050783]|uniref:CHAP domain-containing protein n=1 Tax=Nonomuraea sp. NPDC050783 TaxID=3154634 RepID=UPI003466642A